MDVEIVEHHHDPLRRREDLIDEMAHGDGPVDPGAPLGDGDASLSKMGRTPEKEVGTAVADIGRIFPQRVTGSSWLTGTDIAPECFATLVKAD